MLDTNLLVFIILGKIDEISISVSDILEDFNNEICTSSICVAELLQLFRIGKIKSNDNQSLSEIKKTIEKKIFIKILPFSSEHTLTFANLTIIEGHNDPFDHMNISHAMTEKLCLISSDGKFSSYTQQSLDFLYNKR